MLESGQFGDWLRKFLESEGRYSQEQLAVWASRASRKNISFASYLESSGIIESIDLNSYLVKFQRIQRASAANDPEVEPDIFVIKEGILQPGTILGGYKIKSLIGIGGMGVVYRAEQMSLRREVALKLLKPMRSADEEYRRRFLNESVMVAELSHRNIVRAYESGQIRNFLYFSMEYVDGQNYQQILDSKGVIPQHEVIKVILHMCAALQHAKEKGIVHGDIKPANILRNSQGISKLADLGLAKKSFEETKRLFGTLYYMSPESIQGEPSDIRSDIYSLGATAYHLLTGFPPFHHLKKDAILDAQLNIPIPDPSTINPEIDEEVSKLIAWMTMKNPSVRAQSPKQISNWIQQNILVEPITPKPISTPRRRPVESRRRTEISSSRRKSDAGKNAILFLLILLIIAGSYFVYVQVSNENTHNKPIESSNPIVSRAIRPIPSAAPELIYYTHAMRKFKARKDNFVDTLKYISEHLKKANSQDRRKLREFEAQLNSQRAEKLKHAKDVYVNRITTLCKKGKLKKAFDDAQRVRIPASWGYTGDSPEISGFSGELLAIVIDTFEGKLKEVDDLIEKKQYAAAQTILDAITPEVLPGFDRKLFNRILKLERAMGKKIAKKTPAKTGEPQIQPPTESYNNAITRLLDLLNSGQIDNAVKHIEDMKKHPSLIREREDIDFLSEDIAKILEFWNAIYTYFDECVGKKRSIVVYCKKGKRLTGRIIHHPKGYAILFSDNGVTAQEQIFPDLVLLTCLKSFAKKKGFKIEAYPLAHAILLASRGKWNEALPIIESAPNTKTRARWIRRLDSIAPRKIITSSISAEQEAEAEKLYKDLLSAFQREDWDTAITIAKTLLGRLGRTNCVGKHRETIEEMLVIAGGDDETEEPSINEIEKKSFDFKKTKDRGEFFYRKFGGDIGSTGFDNRGQAYVESGKDSLLVFRRPIYGNCTISFEMRIEKGSELRLALKSDQLGGCIQFTSSEFGQYNKKLTKYKKGGRKVTIAFETETIKVTVDGKQILDILHVGKKIDYLAFYLLGTKVKLSKLTITGMFGQKAFTLEQVLRNFDTIGFADIRKKDLPKDNN